MNKANFGQDFRLSDKISDIRIYLNLLIFIHNKYNYDNVKKNTIDLFDSDKQENTNVGSNNSTSNTNTNYFLIIFKII